MSAPDTNIERQKNRHGPSLSGISIAVGAALIALLALGFWRGVPLDEQAAPNGAPVESAVSSQ